MKHVLFTVMCVAVGVITGLYLSQHLADLLPENI
jgi:uncharacterized protein YneF (UPF0154 family)